MPEPVSALSPLDSPVRIGNVTDLEFQMVRSLWQVWRDKLPRNLLRSAYYNGEAAFKDLGIAIPPAFRNFPVVIGWPEKAVRSLAARNIWDGFVAAGQDSDPFGLADLLTANRFDVELPQAIVSAYKHSCSFISTTLGDIQSGEPDVLVMARSAEWSSALWDRNRRALKAALAVTDMDGEGRPSAFVVYLPDVVLVVSRTSSGSGWLADRRPNPLGVVPVEALTYDPQLDRPFGRSRITRAVMDITDRAARTVLRTEISAEFYASPQRYVLGADPEAFTGGAKWSAALSRVLAIDRDEDGDLPQVGQFAQMTMQPHLDMFRQLAAQFAGETGVPLNSLGVVQDNPSSAEAIYAAREDLIVDAQAQNRVFGGVLTRTAIHTVMLRDGLAEASTELKKIQARWANPAFPSPVSASDALVKTASVFPWLAESEVALEMAGFTDSQITRLVSDRKRAQSTALLGALAVQPGATADPAAAQAEADTKALVDKFNALGAAIRAGVTPDTAVAAVGLTGLQFRDGVPITLRQDQ
jgi:hypothetical protein